MAAKVTAHIHAMLHIDETLGLDYDLADDPEITHKPTTSTARTLNATSTPPVTKCYGRTLPLVAGTLALDLTSLTRDDGTTVDFTGLKVQEWEFVCPASNTAGITVAKTDAVTGYNLFGEDNASAEQIEIGPGGHKQGGEVDWLEDVDATHKDITITGTGTEAVEILLVAG
jgi:hypothetical protein